MPGLNVDGTPSPAFDVDPFAAMDPTEFAAGRWDIVVKVRDTPNAEQQVLLYSQGPSVQNERMDRKSSA